MRAYFLTLFVIVSLAACSAPEPPAQASTAAASAQTAPTDSVLYVDVRTPEEYAGGHIKGAVLIPHDQMATRWQELEAYKDRKVVLYCRSGRRSSLAEEVLRQKGFTNLVNAGGFDAVKATGLPVETGSAQQ